MTTILVTWSCFVLAAVGLTRRAFRERGISEQTVWFDGLTMFLSLVGYEIGRLAISGLEWVQGPRTSEEVIAWLGAAIGAWFAYLCIGWLRRRPMSGDGQIDQDRAQRGSLVARFGVLVAIVVTLAVDSGRNWVQAIVDARPTIENVEVGTRVVLERVARSVPARDASVVYVGFDIAYGGENRDPADMEVWRNGVKIMDREIYAMPGYVLVAVEKTWLSDREFGPGQYEIRLVSNGLQLATETFEIK